VVSPHFVAVTGPADVQAVFAYARRTKTTLSVKNSGHDYIARNSRRGSLALWTRGLDSMVFHSSFVPSGCGAHSHTAAAAANRRSYSDSDSDSYRDSDAGPHSGPHSGPRAAATEPTGVQAMTLGAGVSIDAAISFAHAHGATFTAGSAATVGAAGGWLQGGGHSAFSNVHGLAIDQVLQFTVVTPDGKLRVANRCQNRDLFWALRGGGGGTFGVVLDATFAAPPETPLTSMTLMLGGGAGIDDERGFVSLLAEHMREWALEGWGGPATTSFALLNNPLVNESLARVMLAPVIDYVQGSGGTVIIQRHDSFFDYYVRFINGSYATPPPMSTAELVTSRIVPETVFMDEAARANMVDAIMATRATGLTPYFLAVTPLRYTREKLKNLKRSHADTDTSLHPAWYKSVWHVVAQGVQWKGESTLAERRAAVALLRNATATLTAMAPDGCTYASEADPWLENWAEEFWGKDNYARLLDVKRHYDPDNLLSCWHCVGWNASLPDFECISGLAV
jgi:hypothetical protein